MTALEKRPQLPGTEAQILGSSFPRALRTYAAIAATTLGAVVGGIALSGCEKPSNPAPSTNAARTLNPTPLPSVLTFDERVFAIGNDMEVLSAGAHFGEVEQKLLSWGRSFTLKDANGTTIASAHQRALSWGVQIDVFDEKGLSIGTVKENILKSLFSIKSQYSVLNASGAEIASSEKLDFLGTKITVADSSGQMVATMEKGMFNIGGDKWSVTFSGDIDRRLLVFIPAYKTAADNESK